MEIQYQTQRLSIRFFMLMLVLFVIQVGFGLLVSLQHIDPNLLSGTLNFNVARAEHLNLGLLWILTGFIASILYVGPLLSKRELAAPWLIKFLFYALVATVIWNVIAQGFAMKGVAGWWAGQPWIHEGLEYIEAGRAADVVILIGFSILCYVILRTFPAVKKWNEIHWGLAIGVTALTAVWVFGMFYIDRIDMQEYFRWYVVHYWVEGVWEVIHISLVGALVVLLFKVNVKSVGYAVFWGVLLVWLSGLIGNAHHYFWIGSPDFWQFWGSLFSAMEPLPMVFCFWHVYLDSHNNQKPLENAPAFYFIVGSVMFELVGAGILGFTMTFALTNIWSHGTWITPAHGHLALFGTFGMLALGAAYYAIPTMRGLKSFDQRLGKLGFWLMFIGISGLALAFALGGTSQIYTYRTLGLDWFGSEVYEALASYKVWIPIFGFVVLVGAGIVVFDLMTMGKRNAPMTVNPEPWAQPRRASFWNQPLGSWEVGVWLCVIWIFGFIVTASLLSFNLDMVRVQGDPTLPYLLSYIGYPGLLLATGLFVWRFLASMEARMRAAKAVKHHPEDGDLSVAPNPV